MSNSFSTVSREIVDSFVHDVLFIDERAYKKEKSEENPAQDFDLASVSKSFAEKGKLCSFYAPSTKEDIEVCKSLILRPDMVVLDWDIYIPETVGAEDETADVDDDDRGLYTKQFIRLIVEDASDQKIKVVVVYTGQPDLHDIVNQINMSLANDSFSVNLDNCEVSSKNVRILVRSKSNQPSAHSPFKHFMVSYEDLPDMLVSAFSEFVEGLIPCFAMKCMTEIRESSAKILGVYHRGLDAELLTHQLSLADPDDAKAYIANSFGAAITELIMSDSSINTDLWVEKWIDDRYREAKTVSVTNKQLSVTPESVKLLYDNRNKTSKAGERIRDAFSVSGFNKEEQVMEALSLVFHKEGDDTNQTRYDFSALSHNMNLFSTTSHTPKLTLGTIIKNNQNGHFFLCIQQRCDTARVPSQGMGFLFLPLHEEKPQNTIGAVVIAPGKCLYLKKSSKEAIVISFTSHEDGKPVYAEKRDSRYVFESSGVEFEWVNELKAMIAQRFVVEYTSHLSRVGVDEAEWLRVLGQK